MNPQDIESYISVRTGMLATVYGAKDNPARSEVFVRHLKNVPLEALKKAFDKAEICFEKMPSPKRLSELCGEFMPSQSWRYTFGKSEAPDPETGMLVAVKIDPDPPTPGDRIMYRPQDCPEGRAFLAKLREVRDSARAHKWIDLRKDSA